MDNKNESAKLKKYLSVNDLCHNLGFKSEVVKDVVKNIDNYYYDNPKKDKKGKERQFQCTKGIAKVIQKRLHKILRKYNFPSYMNGVVKGKSITDNALIHLGSKTVVTIDIKSCFPNTTEEKVCFALKNLLGFSTKVSKLITKLVTYKGAVPQGTSSSSVVVALCLVKMCREFNDFCQSKGLVISVWADDLTISGEKPELYITDYIKIFQKYGYSCRTKKIKVWSGKKYKEITGRAINNNRITVPKNKIKECYQMLIGLKKGIINQTAISSIIGKLANIRGVDNKKYQKIIRFANKLKIDIK